MGIAVECKLLALSNKTSNNNRNKNAYMKDWHRTTIGNLLWNDEHFDLLVYLDSSSRERKSHLHIFLSDLEINDGYYKMCNCD